ncbi:hypothetical protein QJS10_CPA01g02389 [Acorus calamus]|uniref:Uncharacterized protein n=1 Tax=Acorus calamus TaxID=4465 RepID=A0AAV9FNW1_ACOCL|nr:hypothetical protein QJS10_CPA01g02389 [Acorus calamus]
MITTGLLRRGGSEWKHLERHQDCTWKAVGIRSEAVAAGFKRQRGRPHNGVWNGHGQGPFNNVPLLLVFKKGEPLLGGPLETKTNLPWMVFQLHSSSPISPTISTRPIYLEIDYLCHGIDYLLYVGLYEDESEEMWSECCGTPRIPTMNETWSECRETPPSSQSKRWRAA